MGDGITRPIPTHTTITSIVNSLLVALKEFDTNLVALKQRMGDTCTNAAQPKPETIEELGKWGCQDIRQMDVISRALSQWVSTIARARNNMLLAAQSIDSLAGYILPSSLYRGPNPATPAHNMMYLALQIYGAELDPRARELVIDPENRDKIVVNWYRILNMIQIEKRYARRAAIYAAALMKTPAFKKLLAAPNARWNRNWDIADHLQNLVDWYDCWQEPATMLLFLLSSQLGPAPNPELEWVTRGLDQPVS
ncbi:hypothetical protein ABW20_dc0109242 [Dactylellina cionopaga]|nr:hypothetical protein ABW20_dc0109242 [Dactylellina cionopaga]